MLSGQRVAQLFDYMCARLEEAVVRTPTVAVDRTMLSETGAAIQIHAPALAQFIQQIVENDSSLMVDVDREQLMKISDQLMIVKLVPER